MKKLTAATLLTIFALLALIDPAHFHDPFGSTPWWLIQGALVLIAVALFIWNMQIYYQDVIKPTHSRTLPQDGTLPDEEADELQQIANRLPLTALQARLFALAILKPVELRQRVAEHYIPLERTLNQEVAIDIKIPDRMLASGNQEPEAAGDGQPGPASDAPQQAASRPHDPNIYLPLLVLPKGEFCDNLEVRGPDHSPLALLSYQEYLQLAARILRLLLCLGHGISADGAPPAFPRSASGTAEGDVVHLEQRALCEIIRRAQEDIDVKSERGTSLVSREAERIATLIEQLPDRTPDQRRYLVLAGQLIRKLSLHYVLVASVPLSADGRMTLRYRRALIPELELAPVGRRRNPDESKLRNVLKGWLRILLGARPASVTVSLDNAWACQSYHVRVDAPEGLYLSRQNFVASSAYWAELAADASRVHYRFRRRLGQPYAHFYGRFMPIPGEGQIRPKIKLIFLEVPPGSDFRANVASFACLGLVWLVAAVMSRTVDPGTDAPAFLLVFPGIAASWLGFDVPRHRLFEG